VFFPGAAAINCVNECSAFAGGPGFAFIEKFDLKKIAGGRVGILSVPTNTGVFTTTAAGHRVGVAATDEETQSEEKTAGCKYQADVRRYSGRLVRFHLCPIAFRKIAL
jgi:hypothetical protein